MTILYTPPAYSSVHGDLIYTVSDPKTADPDTYPNYKFIGDVYIDGTLIARLKRVQDPTTNIGIFNVSQIVRNYIAAQFNPTPSVLVAQKMGEGSFNVGVVMKFGEEYGSTLTADITTDSERFFFNSYNGRLLGSANILSDKLNMVASNRPSIGQVFLTSAFCFVPYFPTGTGSVSYSITPVGGGSVHAGTFTPDNAYEMQVLNLAPVALNALSAGTINAATTQYTVEIGSQSYRFKIICEAIHEPYTIHFMSQYGGFESKIFSKVSRKSINIQKKDYGKLPFMVDSSGQVSYKNSNNVFYDTAATYASQYKDRLELNSDLLPDDEYTWLRELVLSPMLYLEESGYFTPVKLAQTDYVERKAVSDSLNNLNIAIEFGNQLNAQFR